MHRLLRFSALFLLIPAATALFAEGQQRITTASAVVLRSEPAVSGKELDRLKLGWIVDVIGRTRRPAAVGGSRDYWYRVKANDRTGWIFGKLLADWNPNESDAIFTRIARQRLERRSKSFLEWTDLVYFCERNAKAARDKNVRAELAFCELRAVQKVCESRREDPWFKKNAELVVYSEPAGQYLLNAERMWELHKKYRKAPIAEEIARTAAGLMLSGECEGFLYCNLGRWQLTRGRYLERYPRGRYIAEMFKDLENIVQYQLNDPNAETGADDKELVEKIEETIDIVAATKKTDERERMVELLNQLRSKHLD